MEALVFTLEKMGVAPKYIINHNVQLTCQVSSDVSHNIDYLTSVLPELALAPEYLTS
jgi:hypothetical protein